MTIQAEAERELEAALAARGLLLDAEGYAAASAHAAARGSELLGAVLRRCYPALVSGHARVAFESGEVGERLGAALAFGAAAADVLGPASPGAAELCAIFNLGSGLVDDLCDSAPEAGLGLLALVAGHDLVRVAAGPRARGWLRDSLPPELTHDATVAFTGDIIETFFDALHDVYEDATDLRASLGAALVSALEAERASVAGGDPNASRLTSVLPLRILESLATGVPAPEDGAGVQLGEALWRIDDLCDLADDLRTGSLNGVVLAAGGAPGRELLAATAAEAAGRLAAGLALAPGRSEGFRCFIQRYAGIPARPS